MSFNANYHRYSFDEEHDLGSLQGGGDAAFRDKDLASRFAQLADEMEDEYGMWGSAAEERITPPQRLFLLRFNICRARKGCKKMSCAGAFKKLKKASRGSVVLDPRKDRSSFMKVIDYWSPKDFIHLVQHTDHSEAWLVHMFFTAFCLNEEVATDSATKNGTSQLTHLGPATK